MGLLNRFRKNKVMAISGSLKSPFNRPTNPPCTTKWATSILKAALPM